MDKNTFINELKKIGITINNYQLEQLDRYYKLLIEENKKINLTRITNEQDVYLKHFYDSLTLYKVIDLNQNILLCDVGTGAGFPGIILKIIFPTLHITLIDSLLKRINFLNLVIKELNLTNIVAIHTRAEDYIKINKNKFDIVTSRAVANLISLSKICLPLVKANGFFIPMKANAENEIKEARKIIKKMNSEIIEINEFNLPIENSHRTLIKIRKTK